MKAIAYRRTGPKPRRIGPMAHELIEPNELFLITGGLRRAPGVKPHLRLVSQSKVPVAGQPPASGGRAVGPLDRTLSHYLRQCIL